ncbi:MAG: hypothetical protein ACR2HA_07240, partial [Nocardioides sp.]
MSDAPYRTNDRRVIPWLLLGLVVLFGGVYVAGYVVTSDRVPRGTTVSGIDIGGQTPTTARTTLADGLADRRREPVRVTAFGQRGRVKPQRAGLDIDVAASVEQAGGGRSWDPARIWDSLTGGDDFDAVVTRDNDALAKAVASFARMVDSPALDGAVRFEGEEAFPRTPRNGEAVDVAAAVEVVAAAYLRDAEPVPLPTELSAPTITKADVSAAMGGFANPAVAGPVYL